MWEPTGPLPAAVYWRRRVLAAAAGVAIAFVAMVAISPDESALTTHAALSHSQSTIAAADGSADARDPGAVDAMGAAGVEDGAGVGGYGGSVVADGAIAGGPTPAAPAAPTNGETASAGAAPTVAGAAPAGSGAVPPGAPLNSGSPVVGSVVGSDAVAPSPVGTPSAQSAGMGAGTPAASATPEQLRPDETPRAAPLAAPVPVPPTGPVPCTNAMIGVTAEIDRPVHVVGEHPVLRLVITDTSAQPCVRDLDSSRQEIVVWSGDGNTRLWSSNDCGNPGAPDLRTLVPGQPVVFAVTWAGLTSAPGCAMPRIAVPAGAYRVVSRLDDDISAPITFHLTP
jgi:hypothetical protein